MVCERFCRGIPAKNIALKASTKRELIWVPVIHTQADLGSVSESVKSLYVRLMGRSGWNSHVKAIDEIWQNIQKEIEALALDYSKVRLYQDGLPECGHEKKIVMDLARAGSHNHRILLGLMEKGAQITGTESPELLLEEYKLVQQVLVSMEAGKTGLLGERQRELSRVLLERRDRHIGARISKTLREGETGILFLGLLHSLEGRLPPDIEVVCLGREALPLRPHRGPGGKRQDDDKACGGAAGGASD